MTNEIVKINASDYGLDESKANELIKNLPQIITERDVFASQFDEVIRLDIEDPATAKRAKELRLRIRDNRTKGIEVWHKTTKDYFLKGGQFVDAIKRKEIAVNERMETDLEKIEKYQENLERERTEKLRADRLEMIRPYTEIEPLALGHMEQAVFDNLLQGFKVAYEARIAAEKKAEEERIAKEKAEAEERERIRLENIRLQKEAEERERQIAAEREKARKEQEAKEAELKKEREKAEAERKALEDKARKEREERERQIAAEREKARKEQEAKEAELKKEREKAEAERKALKDEARKEREEREKLEAEIKAKEAARLKAIEDEKRAKAAAEKKAKLAPDKDKLLTFMQAINDLPRPEVKSIEAADLASKANMMLVKVAEYLLDGASKL